ncbi:MAG: pirin family protein [Opitutae bacterium]|nr:pirin family protein [Opitutae bacterium]
MAQTRSIRKIVTGSPQIDGAGVHLVRVIGRGAAEEFDPFLMLDAFDSRDPKDYIRGFPWHPHRGIETVTYLIEGDIEHGDSLGNSGHILDGGCQWMTAGGGILHQEMPRAAPRMLGLQLWINLPCKDKFAPPQYRDLTADRIPQVREPGVCVGVIAGRHGEVEGATQGDYVKTVMLDVNLEAGADFSLPTDPDATVFIYIMSGAGRFDESDKPIESRHAVLFGGGGEFAVEAGEKGMRFLLLAGCPLREPIAWGGPIVMNTREELDQAFAELENGTFIREPKPRA